MRVEDVSRLAAAMKSRAAQIRLRIGLAAAIALAFASFTGPLFAACWFTGYTLLQLLERWMFPPETIEQRVDDCSWALSAVALVFVNNVIFGLFGALEILTGGPWGAAAGALLISGAVLNVVLTSSGSRPLFYAGLLPQVAYFLMLPYAIVRAGMGWEAAGTIALAAALNIMAAMFTWRLFGDMLDAQRKAAAEAEAANRAKSDFLANMSHEVRTPLNGVLGIASVLTRTQLTPQQLEYVKTIETSALTLQGLLTDILDLSKIEAGAVDLDSEAFHLQQVVRDIANLFEEPARQKGLSLSLDLPSGEVWLAGDRTRFAQILTNLCSNAVKFTELGGVTLRARAGEAFSGGARVMVEVEDTGIGLSEDGCTRLFQRFSQADASITRSYGGTGLGLSISQSLARLMGGEITVRSSLGEGSTFRLEVILPRAQAPARLAPVVTHEEVAAPDEPLRVLLAEDHPVNQQVVAAILSAVAEMTCVEDGQAAVYAALRQPFDIILMDMQMPVMDGLTAVRRIRELEARDGRPRMPIVMLTANALKDHVEQALSAGADLHLAKPITSHSLLTAVGKALAIADADTVAA